MTSGRRVRVVSGRLDDHSRTLAARALAWDADSQAVPGPDVAEPEPWVVHAACRAMDVDVFFPGRGEETKHAKAICNSCPVRAECLDHALAVPERFGVWGGYSERERRVMRRQRNAIDGAA